MSGSALQLAVVYPELLGTYGDGGNVLVLSQRLLWRDLAVTVVPVALGEPVPDSCDLYVVGGGEDEAQTAALAALRRTPGLLRAAAAGTPVLAVCAGLQLLGTWVTGRDGVRTAGLGLLDATTARRSRRAVGELVAVPDAALGLPPLTGFENHGGGTRLGAGATPLGTVVSGVGNGPESEEPQGDPRYEGALQGPVVATYLHGPVLARNPALADLVLGRALGRTLEPIEQPAVDRLRQERLPRRGRGAPPTRSRGRAPGAASVPAVERAAGSVRP